MCISALKVLRKEFLVRSPFTWYTTYRELHCLCSIRQGLDGSVPVSHAWRLLNSFTLTTMHAQAVDVADDHLMHIIEY